jgi:hypothetical protein
MARKVSKTIRSKGERLGWTPLDKVSLTPLGSISIIGRRIHFEPRSKGDFGDAHQGFLIP